MYVLGTQKNCLIETDLLSTHNIIFDYIYPFYLKACIRNKNDLVTFPFKDGLSWNDQCYR